MGVSADVQVFGVRDSLAVLGQIDRKQRAAAVRQIKAAGSELVRIARETYPDRPPLSGMQWGKRFAYEPAKVQRGVQIQVGGRARFGASPLVTIIQKDAAGALYDVAGLRKDAYAKPDHRDNKFTANLTEKTKRDAQRGMWRNIKKIRDIGYDSIVKALDDVCAQANRKLVR